MAKVKRLSNGHLLFYCPGCESFQQVKEPTWKFNGDFEKPTFYPSIKTEGSNKEEGLYFCCHSFVTDGKIKFLNDCTHNLKNQTVDLPDIEDKHGYDWYE